MTVQPLSDRRSRRAFTMPELRLVEKMYLSEKLSVPEIARRLGRDKDTLYPAIKQYLDIPRRQPDRCGTRFDLRRRNAKIVEAVLNGDSWDQVMRRWEISERVLYEVLYQHKRRVRMSAEFWRENILSRRSGLR